MASIIEKFDFGKKQDKMVAEEFSNEIGKLLSKGYDEHNERIVMKTVDLILTGLQKDENFRKLIEDKLIADYPQIQWSFKK